MHRLIRNTHLIIGMASVLFVLMYAISAVQMAHQIRTAPRVEESEVQLTAGLAPRPVAEALGYNGELGNPQLTPKGFRVTITRPGTNYVVSFDRATGMAHVRRENRSFLGMLNRLHHQNGLHHADGVLNVWGWALLVMSIVFLAIGISGIYLWFKIHRERRIGTVLLGVNLLVSVGLLIALRF